MATSKDETRNCDYIRFVFCDILGRSRGKIVPEREFQRFKDGISVFGGTLYMTRDDNPNEVETTRVNREFQEPAFAVPDEKTIHRVPWGEGQKFKVMDIICETHWMSDLKPQLACPRYVAKRQLAILKNKGFKLFSAFEMEFFVEDPSNNKNDCKYMDNIIHSKYAEFLFNIESVMNEAKVPIEYFHSEHDPGLFEMVLKPQFGISSADSAFVFTSGVLEMDHQGSKISFDSRVNDSFVGKHFNHSLWANGENVFKSSKAEMCELGLHWLSGLIHHAKALTAIFSPSELCYKRLHNPYVPGDIYWDTYDRSSLIKLKEHSGKGTYLENRMPSGLSNPYLVMAATVAAGLDGIERKLTCPPAGRKNAVGKLPANLSEAVEELLSDSVIVEALGEEFVRCYVATISSSNQ